MSAGTLTWFYAKLGARYPGVYLAVELLTAFGVTAGTLALFTFYWDVDKVDFLLIAAISMTLTALTIAFNLVRTYPMLRPIVRWIAGDRSPQRTDVAWKAAVGLPKDMVRRNMLLPVVVVVIPSCAAAVAIVGLSWATFIPLFAAALVAVGYGAILHYLALEAGMRPVLVDIHDAGGVSMQRTVRAIPVRVRLMAALPLINLVTGLVVAALTSEGGGGSNLGVDVLVAVAVATTISLELTVLLSRSILRPIADLRRATDAVRRGDLGASVPVTTGDELGELATSFNEMVEGLAERERLLETLGTYMDHEIAEYILSDGFSEDGVELDVSVLFCDIRDFTSFAAGLDAKEVVAALNRLFEIAVPIIARRGGHVDKFEGDGLLAVFGAPQYHPDHADRAVWAACELARAVNEEGRAGDGIRIGIGISSGPVVAGSIGGAGRLDFSVIGDPVNIASRVEAATRELEDSSALITEQTKDRLGPGFELDPRGEHDLKGIEEPVALYAPSQVDPPRPERDGDAAADRAAALSPALRAIRSGAIRAARRATPSRDR
jgi:adenylate cyclase